MLSQQGAKLSHPSLGASFQQDISPLALRSIRPRIGPAQVSRVRPIAKGAGHSALYDSKEWKALRAEVMAERGRRCAQCGQTEGRMHCDHIIELRDGGAPLDKANVQVLCHVCHCKKTVNTHNKRMGWMPPPKPAAPAL